MKITEADVQHVADLANLEVMPEEKSQLALDLSSILAYVEQLSVPDVSAVEATAEVVAADKHSTREDRVTARTGSGDAAKTVRLFKVPKVITNR
jgi:aspartyl-tRNA(Asn)/glutamyl-tRNA(Gln) amidotransferase subunit C